MSDGSPPPLPPLPCCGYKDMSTNGAGAAVVQRAPPPLPPPPSTQDAGEKKEEEEEDDYMSDAFLASVSGGGGSSGGVDVGGVQERLPLWKRKAKEELQAEHRAAQPPPNKLRKIEAIARERTAVVSREEALAKPLSQSNKGFAMLMKMGFKKGDGLGKDGAGIHEPINVNLKQGRAGLGHAHAVKQRSLARAAARVSAGKQRERNSAGLVEDFRARKRREFTDRRASADLPPSQRACEQLDKEAGLTESSELWFKPPVPPPETDGAGALLNPAEAAAAVAAQEAELTEFDTLEVAEALCIVTAGDNSVTPPSPPPAESVREH